jgi:hypothetical protein
MNDFFKSLGEAAKDRIARLTFFQMLLLVAVSIFAATAARHFFP